MRRADWPAQYVELLFNPNRFKFPVTSVYLDVDPEKIEDPLLLIINTANQQEYNRKWSIRIRQIPCRSQFRGKYPPENVRG